jgi:hypothetical protein
MTAGSLIALRWLAESDVDYIVRLDTDALIIGDYRPSIHSAISGSPEVGVWGAYTRNEVGGDPRDFSHFRRMLWHAALPVRPRRGGSAGLQLEQALIGQTGRARTFLTGAMRDARRHGYQPGEHCLGGAYAVTRLVARQMRDAHYLDDPLVTTTLRMGEDVMVCLLASATGFKLGSLVAPGEAFAVKHHGLLAAPADLEARGHAVIHSVKDDERHSEAAIRGFFAPRRPHQTSGF